jgi:large repetitive protein
MRRSAYLLPFLLLGCGDADLEAATAALVNEKSSDGDLDGVTEEDGDCDDTLASVNPYSSDLVGDFIDQNCDGVDGVDADGDGAASIDSGGDDCDDDDEAVTIGSLYYADADADGHGNGAVSVESCEPPAGFVSDGTDCDDLDPGANPSTVEACDGIDNNCDGETDEGVTADYFIDADGDGFGTGDAWAGCEQPEGYVTDSTDCNDGNPWANDSAAEEICDGYDNNCNFTADEGVTANYYIDADGDGAGLAGSITPACEAPEGYVDDASDCDDENPWASDSTADEVCDGYDNNCDGESDEGVTTDYFIDSDGDGAGGAETIWTGCEAPQGYIEDGTDCDDGNAWASTYAAPEVCDGYDNNCNGAVDEGATSAYYLDADGDGSGAGFAVASCEAPEGYVTSSDDCDDEDADLNVGAQETCNGIDDDCDGLVDDDDDSTDASTKLTSHADSDGDGFGNPEMASLDCWLPEGYVYESTDCDDGDAGLNEADVDGDGQSSCSSDCDDSDAGTYVGAAYLESEEDCMQDSDGDGYGSLEPPEGALAGTDCDDGKSFFNPLVTDSVGDGLDQNCDGTDGVDTDGDGYPSEASGGWDCDDLNILSLADTDGDGFTLCDGDCDDNDGDLSLSDADGDGWTTCGGDCDDGDAVTYPGAAWLDSDVLCSTDFDGDGYGESVPLDGVEPGTDCDDEDEYLEPGDWDGDGFSTCEDDCDDSDPWYNPDDYDADGASTCGGDCDDFDGELNILDADIDGYSTCEGDCDDSEGVIHPEAAEICDGIDNNCDGLADDEAEDLQESSTSLFYVDSDGDGFGDANLTVQACSQPSATSTDNTDCDDDAAAVNTSATEVCDGIDNDCNESVDDADEALDSGTATTWYLDDDTDGFGDPGVSVVACEAPVSHLAWPGDCDDSSAALSPADVDGDGQTSCDGDCDDLDAHAYIGAAELDDPSACMTDRDQDGYGDAYPNGLVTSGLDCDDSKSYWNPDITDNADDGLDQNCDGVDGYDGDGDGYAGESSGGLDCDDNDPALWEVCTDNDEDGYHSSDDCDDEDPRVWSQRSVLLMNGGDKITVEHADLLDLGGGDSFTIDFWIRPTEGSEGVLVKGTNETNEYAIHGAQSSINFKGQNEGSTFLSSDEVHPLEVWSHFTIVHDAGDVTFYRNGEETGSGSNSMGAASTTSLTIGNHADGSDSLDGDIANVSIIGEALTSADVYNLNEGYNGVSDFSLIAHWPIDEGAGSDIADGGVNGLDGTLSGGTWVSDVCLPSSLTASVE